jgi:chorismate dehydratase
MGGVNSMLNIGKITYTNILPIYYYFREEKFREKVRILPQIPSQLNKHMKEGNIDLGPISSFAYADNYASYYLLPNLSVSCQGPVGSIFLYSKKPIEKLNGSSIALTSSSATSVALLKLILEYFYQVKVTYQTMSPDLNKMMEENDASLLIGDDALRATLNGITYPYKYDLGDLWYQLTNRSMTFAVWAVRKEVAQREPRLLSEIHEEFIKGKYRGELDRGKLIQELIISFGGTEAFWETYFSGIIYDFNDEHRINLAFFYNLAYEVGLLEAPAHIELWKPEAGVISATKIL